MRLELKEHEIIWMGRSSSKPEGFMIPTHLKVTVSLLKWATKTIHNKHYLHDFGCSRYWLSKKSHLFTHAVYMMKLIVRLKRYFVHIITLVMKLVNYKIFKFNNKKMYMSIPTTINDIFLSTFFYNLPYVFYTSYFFKKLNNINNCYKSIIYNHTYLCKTT